MLNNCFVATVRSLKYPHNKGAGAHWTQAKKGENAVTVLLENEVGLHTVRVTKRMSIEGLNGVSTCDRSNGLYFLLITFAVFGSVGVRRFGCDASCNRIIKP